MVSLVVALVAVLLLGLALAAGWFGDLVALALPLVTWVSVAGTLAALLIAPDWVIVPLALAIVSVLLVVWPRRPTRAEAPTRSIHIVAANIQFDSPDPDAGVASLLAMDADVLVVSELRPGPDEQLTDAYPFRLVSPPTKFETHTPTVQGVFSRIPITLLDPPDDVPGEIMRVAVGGDIPFTLYAMHLPRPVLRHPPPNLTTFPDHRRMLSALIKAVDAEAGPVVATGDLNLSDRMPGYRDLAQGRLDVMRTGRAASTFHKTLVWRLLSFRIDHLVVSPEWGATDAQTLDIGGSDHRAVSARIGPTT